VLRSGATRRETLPLRTFDYTWTRAGRWAVTVLPPDRLAATATEAQALDAALGFERAAAPGRAALAYRTLLTRWPDNQLAGIGLGNTLNAAGDVAGAAAAFEAVARRHDSAVAWINLARLRLAAGDAANARAAAEQAVRRAQAAEPAWQDAAASTLEATRKP
jgi:tetratricopeptide (TPR) repeat protein